MSFSASGNWQFPVGTVLVKHFELEVPPGVMRRIETRVLLRHECGWEGYTYRWNHRDDEQPMFTSLLNRTSLGTGTALGPA